MVENMAGKMVTDINKHTFAMIGAPQHKLLSIISREIA